MEPGVSEAKYQKLASEYSKLRAQAGVLKKAVLEDQAREVTLRDQLRQRESSLRRAEQEVDSLSFRNRQLESRVAALQEDFVQLEAVKKKEVSKRKASNANKEGQMANDSIVAASTPEDAGQEQLIFEELQRKIMENAQLASRIDDNEQNMSMYKEHIDSLEQRLELCTFEQNDLEKRLRKEIDELKLKNCELETKLAEAGSMLDSEDALSVSGSEHTPAVNLANQHNHYPSSAEERIAVLGKEVVHWRAQYEVAKLLALSATSVNNPTEIADDANCSCSTTAAGISMGSVSARSSKEDLPGLPTKEQVIYNIFSKKFEDLLHLKHLAESELLSYKTEMQNLQICLEHSTQQLAAKDEHLDNLNCALQTLEEDLATTRTNYEEQISVLTEQVISLSEQLASSK